VKERATREWASEVPYGLWYDIVTWKMEERDSPTRLRGKRLFGIPDEALPHQARYI
jgi:hypothetical protein